MANIELIIHPYIAPVYVTTTNMIIPLVNITLNSVYTSAEYFFNIAVTFMTIAAHTVYFIAENLYTEFDVMDRREKFLTIVCLYNVIIFIIAEQKFKNKTENFKKEIKSLQKQINMMEILRDDNMEVIKEEMSVFQNETNLKYSTLDKKIKNIEPKVLRLQREIKVYE